jgi:threonine dehydratase
MYQSWLTHRVVIGGAVNTQADGLAVRVPVPQALEDMRDAVDEMILVEEEQITVVTRYALKYAGLILEPSGAVSLAGILSHSQGESTLCPGPVAAILTGANIACD